MKTIQVMCAPILAMAIFQLLWNMVMVMFLGNFHSRFGDWIYSRDCDYHATCGGNRVMWYLWVGAAVLSVTFGLIGTVLSISARRVDWSSRK